MFWLFEYISPRMLDVILTISLSLSAWTALEKVADPLILGNEVLCGLKCLGMDECRALHYDKTNRSCTLAKVGELYCIVLTILCYALLHCTLLYRTVLHYCTVLYCTVLYSTVFALLR